MKITVKFAGTSKKKGLNDLSYNFEECIERSDFVCKKAK